LGFKPISTDPPGQVDLSLPASAIGKGTTSTLIGTVSVQIPLDAMRYYCVVESGLAIGFAMVVEDNP
jgi:hypothetical protein